MALSKKNKQKIEDQYVEYNEMITSKDPVNVLKSIKVDYKAKTPNQKKLINEIKNKEITICSGFPGSGKTFLACAVALELLKNEPKYKKIVLIKSVTVLQDENIGYLKGDLKEKMAPYVYSFLNNFEKIIGKYNVETLRAGGMIEDLPIAYIRGINIDNAIVIIDECQNISVDNMRTIMTRLGENSKMIFLGDENQVDLKNKDISSLKYIINKFMDFEEVGTVILGEEDVIRNPFIKKIEQIFRDK